MSNYHDNHTVKLLRELVVQLHPPLSDSEIAEVTEFIDVDEYGLAAETACDIVLENNKQISAEAYGLFVELGRVMGISKSLHLDQLRRAFKE